jgi:hypothetical protein
MFAALEAVGGHVDDALPTLDEGLALGEETGEHWKHPPLSPQGGNSPPARRDRSRACRGRLPERDRHRQGASARSYELFEALAVAKLYQSTARPAEAHAVLAPAFEGFSPTAEMPEIAEAQALLTALGAPV